MTIQYGNANRTFTESDLALKQCNAGPNPPVAADFNGDGTVDLIAGESGTEPDCFNDVYSETVNFIKGEGNQMFAPEQALFSNKANNPQLTALRVNRDTKPDLEVLGYGNGPTIESFFINSLSGKFPGCTPPNAATGIHVCSPGSGTLTSPVSFSIGAANQTAGRKVEVWIDRAKVGEQLNGWSYYSFLDASYTVSSGSHTVTIRRMGQLAGERDVPYSCRMIGNSRFFRRSPRNSFSC